jgi:hypothetical protein
MYIRQSVCVPMYRKGTAGLGDFLKELRGIGYAAVEFWGREMLDDFRGALEQARKHDLACASILPDRFSQKRWGRGAFTSRDLVIRAHSTWARADHGTGSMQRAPGGRLSLCGEPTCPLTGCDAPAHLPSAGNKLAPTALPHPLPRTPRPLRVRVRQTTRGVPPRADHQGGAAVPRLR